jgi:uncharacterized protein
MELSEFFQRVGYVTLKLTNGCNLSCSYCNVEALTPQTPKMSLAVYKRVADLLLQNSRQGNVGLEFHGGEPLLLPDEWFEEAVAYARSVAKQQGKFVEFPLVTNATMLTEERLLRLHRLGIRFCISADGPPHVNDTVRGGGHAVERAIQLFNRHRIGFGVLAVLSRANAARMSEVMDWFHESGVRDFRVNFLQPQGRGADESQLLSGDEMFEGMRQVLDHMYRTSVSVSEAETLWSVERFLVGRQPNPPLSCWEFQCQAGRTYVAVDLLGRMHACGTDLVNHVIGHVNHPFDENHYQQVLLRLHDKGDWVIRCFDCTAKRICRHSCSTSDYNSDTYKEHECRYTKLMYRHLCEHPHLAQHINDVVLARRLPRPGSFVPIEQLQMAQAN